MPDTREVSDGPRPELKLDAEGRPSGVAGPLDFRFRAYDDFVCLTKRQRVAVREACKDASQGESPARYIHWLGAEQMRGEGANAAALQVQPACARPLRPI
jgi:hypothetical protein